MTGNRSRKRYPEQVVLMLSTDMKKTLVGLAERLDVPLAEVNRTLLAAGLAAIGLTPAQYDSESVSLADLAGGTALAQPADPTDVDPDEAARQAAVAAQVAELTARATNQS